MLWRSRTWLRFTPLVYWLIAAHCLVLIIGSHWTYEHVPLGDWVNRPLHWKRNNYDRLGHFVQGFVPVLVAREILIRRVEVTSARVVVVLAILVTMGASAIYEIVEMVLAVTGSAGAKVDAQGDVWDPEWDMLSCLVGAVTSLLALSRIHDRQISIAAADRT